MEVFEEHDASGISPKLIVGKHVVDIVVDIIIFFKSVSYDVFFRFVLGRHEVLFLKHVPFLNFTAVFRRRLVELDLCLGQTWYLLTLIVQILRPLLLRLLASVSLVGLLEVVLGEQQRLLRRELIEVPQRLDHVAIYLGREEALVDALPERGDVFLQAADLHVL